MADCFGQSYNCKSILCVNYQYLTYEQEHEHEVMSSNLQVWCDRLLGLTFEVR